MQEECLICKAPLEYLETDELMECEICHKKENSKTRCINGHYVCNECHTEGLDSIIGVCLNEDSRDPVAVLEKMMALPFCHMHGPEHHVMVGAALLTAYKNSGGDIDLESALKEMMSRGRSVPGGACGFWGACGAGISSGMFISIISGSTPLENEPFAMSHKMTARSLDAIADVGGPRCCKRDSYLSILEAVDFTKEHFGIEMEKADVTCTHSAQNNQCIGMRCPFSKMSEGIISISNHCFSNDPGIRCAILPDSIRELGVGAFSGCVNLESVKLNEGLKRLKKDTFSGCIRLENVHLPDTLESIGEWAFRGCASLKKIVIPNNVREICAEAFLSCPDLTIIAEECSFAAAFAEQYGIKCIEVKDE